VQRLGLSLCSRLKGPHHLHDARPLRQHFRPPIPQLRQICLNLFPDLRLRYFALMAVVNGLGRILQAQRDKQPNRDREQVHEEVANSVNAVLRCVDIEHVLPPWKGQP
jgi:hypothetical protein